MMARGCLFIAETLDHGRLRQRVNRRARKLDSTVNNADSSPSSAGLNTPAAPETVRQTARSGPRSSLRRVPPARRAASRSSSSISPAQSSRRPKGIVTVHKYYLDHQICPYVMVDDQ